MQVSRQQQHVGERAAVAVEPEQKQARRLILARFQSSFAYRSSDLAEMHGAGITSWPCQKGRWPMNLPANLRSAIFTWLEATCAELAGEWPILVLLFCGTGPAGRIIRRSAE